MQRQTTLSTFAIIIIDASPPIHCLAKPANYTHFDMSGCLCAKLLHRIRVYHSQHTYTHSVYCRSNSVYDLIKFAFSITQLNQLTVNLFGDYE